MTRSVIDGSGLMKILSTSGPYLCRATMDLRKREEDKLMSAVSRASQAGLGDAPLLIRDVAA